VNCAEYNLIEVDEIPGEQEWALFDEPFAVTLVMQRGCWSARNIADAWAAYRAVMRKREGPRGRPPRWLRAV
jgi:hypothetical protein